MVLRVNSLLFDSGRDQNFVLNGNLNLAKVQFNVGKLTLHEILFI